MEPFRSRNPAVLRALRAGFTLLEMLVVLAIITIVMGVVFTSQGAFNRTLILSNTAYDVALFIRSAETYGITTRVVGTAANAGYGVDFTASPNDRFTLFHDVLPSTPSGSNCHGVPVIGNVSDPNAPDAKPGDCLYSLSEKVTEYKIQNGITVKDLCTYSPGSGNTPSGWTCGRTKVDVTFARPSPEPKILYNGSTSNGATAACIVLQSGASTKRYVSIAASGNVAVLTTPCP